MIVSSVKGGLGNMMFQISAGISLSLELNTDYYYTYNNWNSSTNHKIDHYPNTIFKNIKKLENLNNLEYFVYEDSIYKEIIKKDNLLLDGYFQSEKYFLKHKEHIKSIFSVDTIEKYKDYCFIHIRRGDYLKFQHVHPVISDEYYLNALKYIKSNKIVVLTDDKEYIKNHNIFKDFEISNSNTDLDDLSIMKSCSEAIIGNSTFSWWGSYLSNNNNLTIAPKKWFNHISFDKYKDIYTEKMIII